MQLNRAIQLARDESLDLIEISPNANPPVCKLWIWANTNMISKKANQAKKKQKIVSLKEIKLRLEQKFDIILK